MLLPSSELKELARRVDICLSGKTAPEGCDIRFRQFYWLMLFDDRGELVTACRLADRLSEQKKLGMSLPESLVAIVDSGLQVSPSLEQLERRYVDERGSATAYDALVEKVDQLQGVGQMRVADFLVSSAASTADPVLSRVRGILMRADACDHQVINHSAYAVLRKSIEAFIDDHPGHSLCGDLVEPLTDVALKYTFDLPAMCRSYAQAWSGMTADSRQVREGLSGLSRQLLARCEGEVTRAEQRLARMKPGAYGWLRLQARLGRARQTLDGLDSTKTFGVMRPIHAEWRSDATARLGAPEPSKR